MKTKAMYNQSFLDVLQQVFSNSVGLGIIDEVEKNLTKNGWTASRTQLAFSEINYKSWFHRDFGHVKIDILDTQEPEKTKIVARTVGSNGIVGSIAWTVAPTDEQIDSMKQRMEEFYENHF